MFAREQVDAMKAHAIACYPRESCGLVVAGVYRPSVNLAAVPTEQFRIAQADLDAAGDDLQAMVHSHPDGPAHPTELDMRQQIAWGVPWAIIVCGADSAAEPFWWGDGTPRPPLMDRPFRWGVNDCYALIRDWYRERRGVMLPDFAREWGEWEGTSPRSGYLENFAAAGFRDLQLRPANKPDVLRHLHDGDLPLMRYDSQVPNHSGVICGGLFLHHLASTEPYDAGRLPRESPMGLWLPRVTHWLRHQTAG